MTESESASSKKRQCPTGDVLTTYCASDMRQMAIAIMVIKRSCFKLAVSICGHFKKKKHFDYW